MRAHKKFWRQTAVGRDKSHVRERPRDCVSFAMKNLRDLRATGWRPASYLVGESLRYPVLTFVEISFVAMTCLSCRESFNYDVNAPGSIVEQLLRYR